MVVIIKNVERRKDMVVVGIAISILGFILCLNGVAIIGIFMVPIGAVIARIGLISNNNKQLYNLLHDAKFVGRNLDDIEKSIGVHSNVNVSNDDKRIYSWGDYLELLCNKNNKCIEVLKNSFADKRD